MHSSLYTKLSIAQPTSPHSNSNRGAPRYRRIGSNPNSPRIVVATRLRSRPNSSRNGARLAKITQAVNTDASARPTYTPVRTAPCTAASAFRPSVVVLPQITAPPSHSANNPALRQWLRQVGERWFGRTALISGAVYGGHEVPVLSSGLHRVVAESRREQQLCLKGLPEFSLPLRTIDAITGQIGFEVYGPGQVHQPAAVRARQHRGDHVLRGCGGESVFRSDDRGYRIVGLDGLAVSRDHAAHQIHVGLPKIKQPVVVGVARDLGE